MKFLETFSFWKKRTGKEHLSDDKKVKKLFNPPIFDEDEYLKLKKQRNKSLIPSKVEGGGFLKSPKVGDMVYVDPYGQPTLGYTTGNSSSFSDTPFRPMLYKFDFNKKYKIEEIEDIFSVKIYDEVGKLVSVPSNYLYTD